MIPTGPTFPNNCNNHGFPWQRQHIMTPTSPSCSHGGNKHSLHVPNFSKQWQQTTIPTGPASPDDGNRLRSRLHSVAATYNNLREFVLPQRRKRTTIPMCPTLTSLGSGNRQQYPQVCLAPMSVTDTIPMCPTSPRSGNR